MKNVKLRVPEGRGKEAHDYMLSISGRKQDGLWPQTIAAARHLYLDKYGLIGWTGEGAEDFFKNATDHKEMFLPGFGPEYDDLSIEDYFEKRIREMAKNPKNGLNLWHLHFIIDRLDQERNK